MTNHIKGLLFHKNKGFKWETGWFNLVVIYVKEVDSLSKKGILDVNEGGRK